MEELKQSTTAKAVGSLKWSALMEVVSRTASPIIFVVLARLLTPADFGVMATAMIAISFSQMFWDAGLSKALIQTKAAPEEAAHVVFWTNVVLGLLIYLLLFLAAPAIALFFKSPASGPVLRVLGIQIILASLSSVQQALFVRDLDFRGLFWIKLLTAFIPALFSIPLAFYGHGVWALVAGSLVGQIFSLFTVWQMSSWRPAFKYNADLARKLFGFGFWVFLEIFGAWLLVWSDNLVVGRFLGVNDLGIYRTAWNLVFVLFGLVLNPLLLLIYPTFSRMQDNIHDLTYNFFRVTRLVISFVLPIGIGLLLIAPEIASVLFGQKWQGLGFVMSILGLTYVVASPLSLNMEIYRAMGKPKINAVLMYLCILYYLPAYYIAAQYGLEAFTITRLIVAIIGFPIQLLFCVKILRVSPLYLWHEGRPMIFATTGMALAIALLKWSIIPVMQLPHAALSLSILIITGCVIYIGFLWFLDKSFVLQVSATIRKAVA